MKKTIMIGIFLAGVFSAAYAESVEAACHRACMKVGSPGDASYQLCYETCIGY
jgi:hypothetical protein